MIPTEYMIEKSREELCSFIKFLNEKIGYHPIIIGGWAVDFYNQYFGSKDIDVVFPFERSIYYKILMEYYKAEGYVEHSEGFLCLEKTFRKVLETPEGKNFFVEIDACCTKDKNLFKINHSKELPYALVTEKNIEIKIGQLVYKVPEIELLLSYKLKAYSDRNYNLSRSTNLQDITYFTSKRDKDGSDVISLLDEHKCKTKINFDKLKEIAIKFDIQKELIDILEEVGKNPSAHTNYKHLDGKSIKQITLKAKNALK